MFNKTSMFPKTADPQAARGLRTGPGHSASAQPSSLTGHAADTAQASRESPTNPGIAAAVRPAAGSADAAVAGDDASQGTGSRLIVGPDVKLKGAEILDCDTLVVEGRVEATMDSRVIRIAENGSFAGTVGIDVAEVRGRFEGELTARSQLVIHATGRVSGKIRYGKILIEEGGEISGDVQSIAAAKDAGRTNVRDEGREGSPKVAVAAG